jgi:hypothetical protein
MVRCCEICGKWAADIDATEFLLLFARRSALSGGTDIAFVFGRRDGNCYSDFVLSETAYMIGSACFFQPRNHGRDMVVEPVNSDSIFSSIAFCLLNVICLCTKKLAPLGCSPLKTCCSILMCYFKVLSPAIDLEESLQARS